MTLTRSKMGGSKDKRRRAKATKSNRGIKKPKGPYASLADRFSSPPKEQGMDVQLTKSLRRLSALDPANIIMGTRSRKQSTDGEQYRQQQALASRRSVTRRQHKKMNEEVDDLSEMFGRSTRLGV